jgi:hypothetical protein
MSSPARQAIRALEHRQGIEQFTRLYCAKANGAWHCESYQQEKLDVTNELHESGDKFEP